VSPASEHVAAKLDQIEQAAAAQRDWYEWDVLRAAAREDALRRALRRAQLRFSVAWVVAVLLALAHGLR
jgi:hypothetical protein